jgi:hypothetical protein
MLTASPVAPMIVIYGKGSLYVWHTSHFKGSSYMYYINVCNVDISAMQAKIASCV